MSDPLRYVPLAPEHEAAFAQILGAAFGFDPKDAPPWVDAAGRQEIRVVLRGDEVVAGLFQIPMGQFFGGRSVSMMGVAGVAVRIDQRRRGVASHMMTALVHEALRRGTAISTLYAANQTLYRKIGYEAAGSRFAARLLPQDLRITEASLVPRVATAADRDRIRALYRKVAATRPGFLDRGPYIWPRQHEVRFGVRAHGVVLENDAGELEGYVFYRHVGGADRGTCEVTDLIAATPRAQRQVWSVLGNMASIIGALVLHSAPHDPAYLAHPDPRFAMELRENWMVRLIDVPRALAERGYPPAVRLRLELAVRDDVIAENARRFVVEIRDGRATVREGGDGSIDVDVRGLAQLYTGFADPYTVCTLDRLTTSPAGLDALASAFGGPLPWMQEMF